jgi:cation diffusion facilitator family transporter
MASIAESRYGEVRQVLVRILYLNLAVALAKIVFGQLSGSISILSDGVHSLTDGASNVVALVGLRLARKPPDANHPYGHRKFETLAAGGIALFLLIVVVEVAQTALTRFRTGGAPSVSLASYAIMFATLAINIAVVWLDGATPLTDAHAVSHHVKDLLMDRYPQIADAIIHIEPPPRM